MTERRGPGKNGGRGRQGGGGPRGGRSGGRGGRPSGGRSGGRDGGRRSGDDRAGGWDGGRGRAGDRDGDRPSGGGRAAGGRSGGRDGARSGGGRSGGWGGGERSGGGRSGGWDGERSGGGRSGGWDGERSGGGRSGGWDGQRSGGSRSGGWDGQRSGGGRSGGWDGPERAGGRSDGRGRGAADRDERGWSGGGSRGDRRSDGDRGPRGGGRGSWEDRGPRGGGRGSWDGGDRGSRGGPGGGPGRGRRTDGRGPGGARDRGPGGPRVEREPQAEAPPLPRSLPAEGQVLYGRNAVHELLRADRRRIHALWATAAAQEAEAWIDRDLARTVEADELTALVGTGDHQGVAAAANPYPYVDLEDLLAVERPLLVALDEVQDPQNVGSIARTAECAGATGLLLCRHRAAGVTPAAAKASAGAVEHLPIAEVRNLADALEQAKQAGAWIYGAAGEGAGDRRPVPYDQPEYEGGVVLVMGAEGSGLRDRVARTCDELVALPLHGRIDSLNVSVATGILLYEILQRRGTLDNGT